MAPPLEELAARLHRAWANGELLSPLTEEFPTLGVEEGYRVQDALIAHWEAEGQRVVGAKLGLTSRAKRREMGIGQPIYGWLTDLMCLEPPGPVDDLGGPGVTAVHVLAATRAVAPAIEVLDSRFRDYRFSLPDVVADNASSGRFVLGGGFVDPADLDLATLGCVLELNGEVVATAAGGAVLGHPARAVAWLARTLAVRGRGLRAGQVVLSGGLTSAVPLGPGDLLTATFARLGDVEVRRSREGR
jgi:2-keto-4-pentenoate hydratase